MSTKLDKMPAKKNINENNNSSNENVDNKNEKIFTTIYSIDCDHNSSSGDHNSPELVNECVAEGMKKSCDLTIRQSNSQMCPTSFATP